MAVEFIPAAYARDVTQRIQAARQRVLDRFGATPQGAGAAYWESLFEANAAEALGALPTIRLTEGFVVRYRFFGQRGRDLLVRPFVSRSTTDVEIVRGLLDWHPAPDSVTAALASSPTQDVDLLYRHFSLPPTAVGAFEYWLAMQEVWASARWAHSHVIASADELSRITAGDGWEVVHPVEAYEPAVVRSDGTARLAVLVLCPLERLSVTLQQIDIAADGSLRYAEPILVATAGRGYLL